MSKKVVVDLSEEGLNNFLTKLKNLDKKLEEANKKIVNDLAENSKKVMKKTYDSSPVKGNTTMLFDIEGDDLNKEAIMYGYQAIYSEFGTGTEGAQHSHPTKGNYDLDDYNSHRVPNGTIRYATEKDVKAAEKQGKKIGLGDLFWTYRDENGEKQYTQGIPAQKEGYNALIDSEKKVKTYARKRIQEVLDDFN